MADIARAPDDAGGSTSNNNYLGPANDVTHAHASIPRLNPPYQATALGSKADCA